MSFVLGSAVLRTRPAAAWTWRAVWSVAEGEAKQMQQWAADWSCCSRALDLVARRVVAAAARAIENRDPGTSAAVEGGWRAWQD